MPVYSLNPITKNYLLQMELVAHKSPRGKTLVPTLFWGFSPFELSCRQTLSYALLDLTLCSALLRWHFGVYAIFYSFLHFAGWAENTWSVNLLKYCNVEGVYGDGSRTSLSDLSAEAVKTPTNCRGKRRGKARKWGKLQEEAKDPRTQVSKS